MEGLRTVREELWSRGVRSILIVPVRRSGHVIGSFSLDSYTAGKTYNAEQRAKCRLLAAIAAAGLQDIYLNSVVDDIAAAMIRETPLSGLKRHIEETAKRFLDGTATELDLNITRGDRPKTGLLRDKDGWEISARVGPTTNHVGLLRIRVPPRDIVAEDVRKVEHLARYAYVAIERARDPTGATVPNPRFCAAPTGWR
jgi:hypothetical protein